MRLLQTLPAVLCLCCFLSCTGVPDARTRSRQVQLLQPLNDFPPELLPLVGRKLEETYGYKVRVLPVRNIPERYYNTDKGSRYCADSILAFLHTLRPDSAALITGLTTADIFTSKRKADGSFKEPAATYANWGIFGLGYRPGDACVVSLRRLRTTDKTLFESRLVKVVLHETGHNLGLRHCPEPGCLMNDALESIRTIDREREDLCLHCRNKID